MKDVILRILGRHSTACEPDDEQVEFITRGRIYNRNGVLYIIYEEGELSGLPNVRTTVKISPDNSVRMRRNGVDQDPGTLMVFTRGIRYEGLYNTPYGPFHMEIFTNRIVDSIDRETLIGSLLVDYNIVLKGLSENHTKLYLELYDADQDTVFEHSINS